MTIGFIGLGNMASAMIGGMLQKGIAKPGEIVGSAKTQKTIERVQKEYDIRVTLDNKEVAKQAEILFLAIKTRLPGWTKKILRSMK